MNAAGLELSILGPAFAAGLLVLATHVPLGIQVLQRGIVFIDLAIAQIAVLGVIAADLAGFEPQGIGVQVAAVGAALLGGFLLTWTEKRWPEVQEALIGVLFILAATGSILLLSGNPHGGEHLKDLLVGQILWVNLGQLGWVVALTAGVLGLLHGLRDRLGRAGFYLLFALSVTASVQLVGIYLVFASLILPALATRHRPRNQVAAGYVVGTLGYACGLVLSAWFDLPSGAVVVWVMTIVAALFFGAGRAAWSRS